MSGKAKLTWPQWRALERLVVVDPHNAFLVGGHVRTACSGLVARGLAEEVGRLDLRVAFKITDAGRARYNQGPPR